MKTAAAPLDTLSDVPRGALPRLLVVVALHVAAALAFMAGNRPVRVDDVPRPAMVVANILPEKVKPPPPPPPPPPPRPPRPRTKAALPGREAAAPRLPDIQIPTHTDIAVTIADNDTPVPAASGKPDGTGTLGAGDRGAGIGGAGGGTHTPVKVRAVLDPANCVRPELPRAEEDERPEGHVILAVKVDVDGSVTDARLARSSGTHVLDRTALAAVRQCHFVAATIDKVPVASWELFRFSWYNH